MICTSARSACCHGALSSGDSSFLSYGFSFPRVLKIRIPFPELLEYLAAVGEEVAAAAAAAVVAAAVPAIVAAEAAIAAQQ